MFSNLKSFLLSLIVPFFKGVSPSHPVLLATYPLEMVAGGDSLPPYLFSHPMEAATSSSRCVVCPFAQTRYLQLSIL